MRTTRIALILALAWASAAPAAAQRRTNTTWPAAPRWEMPRAGLHTLAPGGAVPLLADSTQRRTGEWRLGSAIGAMAFGVAGGLAASLLCGMNESPHGDCGLPVLAGVTVGGLVGFVVGGLIGSSFPSLGP